MDKKRVWIDFVMRYTEKMKKAILIICLCFSGIYANTSEPFVDPQSFSGLWHEIARTPNNPQKDCVQSKVEYMWQEDASYKVHNQCFDKDGKSIDYKGKAVGMNDSMYAMDMTYFWIFTQRYYVYFVSSDYQYAVVADADYDKVWIMSREPNMPQTVLKDILSSLDKKMKIERFIFANQKPQELTP